MILIGTITTADGGFLNIDAEGATYDEARENLYALLEDGQMLIVIRVER